MNAPLPKVGVSSTGSLLHYSVGAILANSKGEVFLMDRKHEPHGYAGFAGHIDQGEEPLEALLREAGEELQTTLSDVRLIHEEEVLWNSCWKAPSHYWYLYTAKVDPAKVVVDAHEVKDPNNTEWWYDRGVLAAMNLEPVWKYWLTKFGYYKP